MDSWGNPPSYFDPDDDVLAKHCVRSLHLPFRAWSDDQMATHLGSMLQRATSHQDSWVQFIAESLDAYPTTGCVQAGSAVQEPDEVQGIRLVQEGRDCVGITGAQPKGNAV